MLQWTLFSCGLMALPLHAFLIHNPVAGHPARHAALGRAIAALRKAGWQVEVRETVRRNHARELAAEAARAGYHPIIIAGGDGSIGQAAHGIVAAGVTDVALGIIPLGSGNVFARDVGLPHPDHSLGDATLAAAQIILAGEAVPLDVGLVNGTAFMCWVGCGLDAAVTLRVENKLHSKRRAPVITYLVEFLRTFPRHRAAQTTLWVDEQERLEGRYILTIVSNIGLYARYVWVTPQAQLNDGFFDLIAVAEAHPLRFVLLALKLLMYPRTADPRLFRRRLRRLEVTTDPPQMYHLDGDPTGQTPFTVSLLPRRLPVYLDRRRSGHRLI